MPREHPAYRDTLEALMDACKTQSPVHEVGSKELQDLWGVSAATAWRRRKKYGLPDGKVPLSSLARAINKRTG